MEPQTSDSFNDGDITLPPISLSSAKVPRKLDLPKVIEKLTGWIADKIRSEGCKGLYVSLAGTDSILTYVLCSKALELAGLDPKESLIGVHYVHPKEKSLVTRAYTDKPELTSWLREFGQVEVVDISTFLGSAVKIDQALDNYRWSALLSSSIARDFWPVGTRNRSEEVLGNYSNSSMIASMLPIVGLWKTEVLQLCQFLGVPSNLWITSLVGDCACGRSNLMANIEEVDPILMQKVGELSGDYEIDRNYLELVENYINVHKFKGAIPYRPPSELFEAYR